MPKINESVEKLLQAHAAMRLNNENKFQAFRSYFMNAGFTKISKYFKSIAKAEYHARCKVNHFILDRGGCLDATAIAGTPKIEAKDAVAETKKLIGEYFDMIVADGKDLQKIYLAALENDDVQTCKWLKEIIMEQIEMEAAAQELVFEFGFTTTKMEVWQIDQHLTY